jgi:hypothetical protein
MLVGNPGVDRGRADALVPQMVLDELEWHPGIKQVCSDGMPKRVAGEVRPQPGLVSVADETGLDLALLQRTTPAMKHRRPGGSDISGQVSPQQLGCRGKERPLRPIAALEPLDDDPGPPEIDVLTLEEGDFSDAEPVVVDQSKESAVADIADGFKEAPELGLSKIAREPLVRRQAGGQKVGEKG